MNIQKNNNREKRNLFNLYKDILLEYINKKNNINDPIISILILSVFKNTKNNEDNITNIQDFAIDIEILIIYIRKLEINDNEKDITLLKYKKILSIHKKIINDYIIILNQNNSLLKLQKYSSGIKIINDCFKKIENYIISQQKNLNKHTENIYCNIIQMSTTIAWILGNGNLLFLNNIKNISYYIGFLYKIYIDIDNKNKEFTYINSYNHFDIMEIYLKNKELMTIEFLNSDLSFEIIDNLLEYFGNKISLISNK